MNGLPVAIQRRIRLGESGCWHWQGGIAYGYGRLRVRVDGALKMQQAHRVVYELLSGSIPEGLELDHLCRTRDCVNPDHLEPVTHRENVLRGEGPSAQGAKRTHCPQSHEYSGDNLYHGATSGRKCRRCNRERKAIKKGSTASGRLRSQWMTDEQRKGVITMRAAGSTYQEIATRYGISVAHAHRVANGKKTGRVA